MRALRVVAQLVKANNRLRGELKTISVELDGRLGAAQQEKAERERLRKEQQSYIAEHGEHPDAALRREIEAQGAMVERAHNEAEALRRQNAKLEKKLGGAAAKTQVLAQLRNQMSEKDKLLTALRDERRGLQAVVHGLQHVALESQRPIESEFETEVASLKEQLAAAKAELKTERESAKAGQTNGAHIQI